MTTTDLFTNPERFADLDGWHAEAAALRAESPVQRVEVPGFDPFWAVLGHAAVMEVERAHDRFHNAPVQVGADPLRAPPGLTCTSEPPALGRTVRAHRGFGRGKP